MEVSSFSSPPLVGRDRELRTLRARLADALAGQGSLVLIGGAAGVGKTALTTALAGEAAAAGALPLVCHCYDGAETPPYGPWIELARRFDATLTLAASPAPRLEAATSQEDLFAQCRAFLVAVAAERPALLVLEDLHWADPASLDLLRYLARGLVELPLLLLATYRADELERHHPLQALVPLLVREAPVTRLALRPLGDHAVQTLVRARYNLTGEEATRLAGYLLARTEGNALFVNEQLRTLEEEGLLRRDAGRWALGDLADVGVPLLLRQIVDARLARLGDEAAALLAIAAVIGQEVPLAVWGAVAGADEEILLDVAEHAEAAHLLAAGSFGQRVRFAHALIREALYEAVPALRRRRLHRQVADALIAAPRPDPDAVASHLQRARDARAAGWLVRAGERAERRYALITAGSRYEAAVAVMEATGVDANERAWLLLRVAALRRFHDPQGALARLAAAASQAEAGGDPRLIARIRLCRGMLRCFVGEIRTGLGDLTEAWDAIEALSSPDRPTDEREGFIDRVANRGTVVAWAAYAGRLDEARAQAERYLADIAVPSAQRVDAAAVAATWLSLGFVHALRGEIEPADGAYAAAREAYRTVNHLVYVAQSLRDELWHVAIPYRADDVAGRERLAREAEEAARQASVAQAIGEAEDFARYPQLPLLALSGAWREAHRVAESLEAYTIANLRHFRAANLGPILRAQGEGDRAWHLVREVWPQGPATEPGEAVIRFTLPLQRLAAELALDAGDLATARAWLEAHERWLAWTGAHLGRAEGLLLRARYLHIAGKTSAAVDDAARALELARSPRQPLALLAAHRALGELAAVEGRLGEARGHFGEALALAEACAAPFERALTLLALAQAEAAARDVPAARGLLEDARTICLDLGAQPALIQIAALTARLDAGTNERPTNPAGLSAREVEVLQLLATGLSNAQIAERLFLSPRTVKVHVAHIFDKIGVANRVAATRFALDHGLAPELPLHPTTPR